MTNYNYNHNLIEIAKKLSDALEQEQKLSTSKTRWNKSRCQNLLKEWLEENYDNNGIKKEMYKKYFGKS